MPAPAKPPRWAPREPGRVVDMGVRGVSAGDKPGEPMFKAGEKRAGSRALLPPPPPAAPRSLSDCGLPYCRRGSMSNCAPSGAAAAVAGAVAVAVSVAVAVAVAEEAGGG